MAIVKKLKQHPPLPPSRYEVGIYCRVSTASKTQVVSAGHQLSDLITDVANSHLALCQKHGGCSDYCPGTEEDECPGLL